MYTVFRGCLPQGNKKFATYEQARQAVRKWIRRNPPYTYSDNPEAILGWTSNPMIGNFGYSIRKV